MFTHIIIYIHKYIYIHIYIYIYIYTYVCIASWEALTGSGVPGGWSASGSASTLPISVVLESQLPHKIVDVSFTIPNINNKLTN